MRERVLYSLSQRLGPAEASVQLLNLIVCDVQTKKALPCVRLITRRLLSAATVGRSNKEKRPSGDSKSRHHRTIRGVFNLYIAFPRVVKQKTL